METRKNSACPVERTLYILRDVWTFMILRDLCTESKGFNQLKKSVEGISSRMLSEKLKFLEEEHILDRNVSESRPVRVTYTLTEKGKSLSAVVDSMRNWGQTWIAQSAKNCDN
ncbi:MAG: helix-turn-helix transcriptional regulator [Candidatus Thermoplasmatota archaeon]|jgi:DNA-binding HxlR family transcriptional regulator|nr:helix-turn-helix transcriptional regulator [Candidatus Thermoplasmatota archaeon]MCL5789790.1 helix-turn-helix transcriptional regulator [Candidatus Thermoplasmatota archaeon]